MSDQDPSTEPSEGEPPEAPEPGSDGSLGLQAVKGAGGFTLVQSPESARYNNMPHNAIRLVHPEVIAEPEDLARQLGSYLMGRWQSPNGRLTVATEADRLSRILERVRSVAGYDFSHYSDNLVLEHYAPPAVVVDDNLNIQFFRGDTQPYLQLPKGSPTYNALQLVQPALREALSTAVQQARGQKRRVASETVKIPGQHDYLELAVEATPLPVPGESERYTFVCFVERRKVLPPAGEAGEAAGESVDSEAYRALQEELEATKRDWQLTIEQLQASNEELRSANEEFQSSNEELQSTNEELDASREELQSLNEELTSVNSELEEKIEQLSRANDDMRNLLESIEVGTLFLDEDLSIKRFTAQVTRLVNLIDSDVGRPIDHLTFNFDYQRGVLLIAFDISERKALERDLRDQRAHLHEQAHRDVLTGLANRLALMKRLESWFAELDAEGVESAEQGQFLIDHECPEVQGNLYSQPLSAEAMTELLAEMS